MSLRYDGHLGDKWSANWNVDNVVSICAYMAQCCVFALFYRQV